MKDFAAQDENYESRVRESFSKQNLMKTIGASLTKVLPGEVEISLGFRDDLTQQHGFIHAGVVSTLADTACGYAAFSLMAPDAAVLTVEYKINLLSPAVGESLVARGKVTKSGRTLTVCAGDVFALKNGEKKMVATMIATIMSIPGREGLMG
ncbi:PaaI family thioesterase [Desulfoferrobacter suflitae]|uniref:PaaI family thioesterase n=1 Tax=Desulfoferrobacter suflitae TaxID=2865782 RepID=UPI0021646513|nr:PaaI family thioesterase [Desulfoferrobacter suflitae]MCK8601661.1 PaaI family thioesterase [Desulfoferrobacter suflitae]